DLAILTHGESIDAAKQAAIKAIQINLNAYKEAGQEVPERKSVLTHLENPDLKDLLFTYVEVTDPMERVAA
ncbi:MAG: type II toxin-antitoxin system HicB family antitoxin, partial [Candidatus Tectomicrobia bacterium]|nr:type II toxin-antitoxin system HicB family antitoxin [Candidatus Tectomicrobia bacterium]